MLVEAREIHQKIQFTTSSINPIFIKLDSYRKNSKANEFVTPQEDTETPVRDHINIVMEISH